MTITDALIQKVRDGAVDGTRVLVGVAGPPGSGKSTLAENLAKRLGPSAAVLPMDGFHLDNAALKQMGLLDRKGAPVTFDAKGFVTLVRALRHQSTLSYPTFDRNSDKTVPDGGEIDARSEIILIEGNYLLLDTRPWSDLATLFDFTVYLDVARVDLETRLVKRWLDHGLSEAEAQARAFGNDMRNVDLVLKNSRKPDFVIRQDELRPTYL